MGRRPALLVLVGCTVRAGCPRSLFVVMRMDGVAGGHGRGELPQPARRAGLLLAAGLLLLAVLLLPATTLGALFPNDGLQPFDLQTSFPLFVIMTTGLVLAAGLLGADLRYHAAGWRPTAVLGALLLAAALRQFYWLAVWDSSTDGLSYLWLFVPVTAVLATAIWLQRALPQRARPLALAYTVVIPLLLLLLLQQAQHLSLYELTGARAARVDRALAAYHAREGHYPATLDELTPGFLVTLSEPLILFGQRWCYDGGGDRYQFGFVFRTHWSDPRLVGQVYSADGAGAGLPPLCTAEIRALQARDPQYYGLEDADASS